MKTILVTGATGFVGSHVLAALQQKRLPELKIVAACRDPKRLPSDYTGDVRVGDLRDPAYRKRLLEGVNVVCHAAAWTSLWSHADHSRRLYLEPTLDLINSARAANVSRFINTSTTSAAAPQNSVDPMSHGIPRAFWPHLCNVVAIEDALRSQAAPNFQTINLRFGIFAGSRYGLGLLPILAPRLKTHLVPWVAGGNTGLPITDGRDIGEAFALAALAETIQDHDAFNIVGPDVPTAREVIEFLSAEYGLPTPHFSVPFPVAYAFAWLMETIDPLVPWEPLVTRSIVHLLEETHADNRRAERLLGYHPKHSWRDAIRLQMHEMIEHQIRPMAMARPIA